MKKLFNHIYLLLSVAVLLISCLESDETEFVLHDDAAITSFSITSAKILVQTKTKEGKDTTYYASSSKVSTYPFSIDHVNGEIFNADSLPYGTDATRLLCEYTTKNSGSVGIENIVGDSVAYLTTTDTIDFSTPRYVRVYSADNSINRRYKITVNVHKEVADSFKWEKKTVNTAFASLDKVNAVVFAGKTFVFGQKGQNTFAYTSSNAVEWTELSTVFGADAYSNVAVFNGSLYILDNGLLKVSADGEAFSEVQTTASLKQLLGASTKELYAMDDAGNLVVSKDGGATWSVDECDDDIAKLPATDISCVCQPFGYVDNADRMVLVGNRSLTAYPNEKTAMVWSKIVEYSDEAVKNIWSYVDFDSSMLYPLPRLSGLKVFAYGKSLMAIGGAGIGGASAEAYSKIYESRDGGLTWKNSSTLKLMDGFDKNAKSVAVAVDADNFIWLISSGTGEVWRGRLNKMGWKK
ncbi:MAG: hypothetical protein J6Q93_04475 [Prevotella sp.]|nr:hypothetical protein [Prevotella sp.]